MNTSFVFNEDDGVRFGKMILSAMAFAAEPELVHAPSDAANSVKAELLAAAAAPIGTVPHPIAQSVARMNAVDRWAALSNAVAGVRLSRIIDVDHALPSWWLHGVREGMREDVDRAQQKYFCPAQFKGGIRFALDEVLDAVGALSAAPTAEPDV